MEVDLNTSREPSFFDNQCRMGIVATPRHPLDLIIELLLGRIRLVTPVSILVEAVIQVIGKDWERHLSDIEFRANEQTSDTISTAIRYMDIVRNRVLDDEYRDKLRDIKSAHESLTFHREWKRYREPTEPEPIDYWALVWFIAIALIGLALLAFGLIYYPIWVGLILLVIVLMTIVNYIADEVIFTRPRLAYERVRELGGDLCEPLWRTPAEKLAIERNILSGSLISAMDVSDSGGNDPDLSKVLSGGAVAIPPGITELTLSLNEEAFQEITACLKQIRSKHLAWSSISFSIFVLATIATFIAAWLGKLQSPNEILLAGGGEAAILVVTFKTLSLLRTSNYALTILASLIAEARTELQWASQLPSSDAVIRRAEIWRQFRREINNLWKEENNLNSAQQNNSTPEKL